MARMSSLWLPSSGLCILLAFLGGCGRKNPVAAPFTQAEADSIAADCGAPKEFLRVHEEQLMMWDATTSDTGLSMCLMEKIRQTGKLLHPVGHELHEQDHGS
jgi:hypothetical protein